MFELLLKYEPELWQRGALALSVPWWAYLALLAGAVLATCFALGYRVGRDAGRTAWLPAALRACTLAVLLLVLCGPVLVVSMPEPHDAHVAVLLDDSLSMRVGDGAGTTRAERLIEAFAPGSGATARALEARYQTHYFGFGVDAARIDRIDELEFASPGTDLGRAVERALGALGEQPLAALVVVSDGGDDASGTLEPALLAARAAGVPVSTVALDSRPVSPDVSVHGVRTPERLLAGDLLDVEVLLGHRGLGSSEVTLEVVHGDDVLVSETLTLPSAPGRLSHRAEVRLSTPGPQRLTARVAPLESERIHENNERSWLVDVVEGPLRALHYEGEPRFEVKFIRRALADDPRVALTSLVRTAENKFYRLGVERAEDLAGGFPDDREVLFEYEVLVLGSLEARAMSEAQQAMVADFVSKRGGGLLLLGGSRAFARGGYAESGMAGLLPVVLPAGTPSYRARVKVRPTVDGLAHPLTRLIAEVGGEGGWERLPALTVLNPVRAIKPGATTLLVGDDGFDDPLVVFAYHRYGAGLVAALPVRDSWRWQMHRDIALEDLTHETLWRQLVRWLAHRAEPRLGVRARAGDAVPGRAVTLELTAFDRAYEPHVGAPPTIEVTSPLGDVETVEARAVAAARGRFTADFTPREPGLYEVRARVADDGDERLEAAAFVEVDAVGAEYLEAGTADATLRRVAESTGGTFYPAGAGALAGDLSTDPGERAVVRRLPLWDAPALFALLVLLACGEWLLRRLRSLA